MLRTPPHVPYSVVSGGEGFMSSVAGRFWLEMESKVSQAVVVLRLQDRVPRWLTHGYQVRAGCRWEASGPPQVGPSQSCVHQGPQDLGAGFPRASNPRERVGGAIFLGTSLRSHTISLPTFCMLGARHEVLERRGIRLHL